MTALGLDVGSRTIKLVAFDGEVRDSIVVAAGPNPARRCRDVLADRDRRHVVVTGYGRHLVASEMRAPTVSEIKAHALGARHLFPDCRTVIDVGGQDSKVTLLTDSGEVQKFEMNDRCAAGTGRFLEVMAATLEVGISDLGNLALTASRMIQVNSLCTVFAESEVVSLISRGEDNAAIALALHEAVATRIAAMARRVGLKEQVVFAGGAALNPCLRELLSVKLGTDITTPDNPQITGALGAALLAQKGGQT